MQKINKRIIKKVVKILIAGNDYRIEIIDIINSQFLQFVLDFFMRVAEAKIKNKDITIDWYKKELLNDNTPTDEIIINAGLNKKTVTNIHKSGRREVVIDASRQHYDRLLAEIQKLTEQYNELDINLTIKMGKVSMELNLNESLIVINTIAVKRASLRGGAWSKIGKKVETPLMLTLCNLFGISPANYQTKDKRGEITDIKKEDLSREVDFYLISHGKTYNCEVKLMGKGNPESADAAIARDTRVFIADKLSENNKRQLDSRRVEWIECREGKALHHFEKVLKNLDIPHKKPPKNINDSLGKILDDILN